MGSKLVIGQPARGAKFFPRNKIITKIVSAVNSGENVLLSAPRRVGKTSIMYNLMDVSFSNSIYLDTESVNDAGEYFKKLYEHVYEKIKNIDIAISLSGKIAKKTISEIDEIGADGIKFDKKERNYYEYLEEICKKIPDNSTLIILNDEFAQTVQNILNSKGKDCAIEFLSLVRTLRQNPEINRKVKFIFAGSIGLENVVSEIEQTKMINDLNVIFVNELNKKEAEVLIDTLMEGTDKIIGPDIMEYMLDKIGWIIPFYVQLIINDLINNQETEKFIKKDNIDEAFKNITGFSHKLYYENWHSRLKITFKNNEYDFVKEILNIAASEKEISSSIIFDIAVKHGIKDNREKIINILKYDGYINNNGEVYKFISPILREWWCNYVTK